MCIAHGVHPVHPADVWAVGVDSALLASLVKVPASAIAPVEKTCFVGQVNVLATQAALGAGKGGHVRFEAWVANKEMGGCINVPRQSPFSYVMCA